MHYAYVCILAKEADWFRDCIVILKAPSEDTVIKQSM